MNNNYNKVLYIVILTTRFTVIYGTDHILFFLLGDSSKKLKGSTVSDCNGMKFRMIVLGVNLTCQSFDMTS